MAHWDVKLVQSRGETKEKLLKVLTTSYLTVIAIENPEAFKELVGIISKAAEAV